MTISEIKNLLNYLLDNNLELEKKGQNKISICIEGNAGCGKTSSIQQVAKERGAGYKRLNISELEEIGDLVGIPQKEYLMLKDGEEKRVSEKLIPQFTQLGYTLCPDCEPVMSYAIPEWVPTGEEDKEFILCLDDYSRGSQLFMQAIMSLIQFGEYISWKLPPKTHLILTSNPDNGNYSVSSLDAAQKSRILTFNVEFDVKPWAKWAEQEQMQSSLINFALLNSEIFDRNDVINARSYTLFANALNNLKDLSTPESMSLANLVAKGAFGDDGNYIAGLFVQFVNNKLDKLITPEQMLSGEWEETQKKIKSNVYKDDNYRADIGSVLTLRFINYIENYFNKTTDKKASEKVINRIIELVTYKDEHDRCLLTEDLIFKLIKTLNAKFPSRCSKMLANPLIRAKIL